MSQESFWSYTMVETFAFQRTVVIDDGSSVGRVQSVEEASVSLGPQTWRTFRTVVGPVSSVA